VGPPCQVLSRDRLVSSVGREVGPTSRPVGSRLGPWCPRLIGWPHISVL
jgi:hypothetical protein